MITKSVLCDTDFLVALHLETDSIHSKAKEIFERYLDFVVLDITFWEVATVLSRKLTQEQAILTLETIQSNFSDSLDFTKVDEVKTFKLYKSFQKKNISFFDCACLVIAQNNNFLVASFDKFYPLEILA